MGRDGERLDGRFGKLWAASTTSALGSGLTTIAAPLFVVSRTSDPLLVSVGFAVSWLPWLLFALPGGVLVDRVDRRSLMVLIDAVRIAAVGVLAVAIVGGWASVPLLYGVLVVVNTGEVVFRAASQAMIPAVVPRARLERANGWLYSGTMLMQGMVASPLGGLLFVIAASIPFFVNAGTYAASAVLIGLVAGRYRAPERDATKHSVRSDVIEGLRWLLHHRLLRTMALLIGLLNVTLVAAMSLLVLLAKERLHVDSVGFGLLFTCEAVGGILGSVFGDRLIERFTATWTIRVGLLIEAGMHLTLAASGSPYLVGFALFAFGVHGSLWGIVGSSLRQRLAPPEMLGRIGSSTLFVVAGGNCVGALLGGALASRFGLTAPYWVGFVVAVAVTVMTWRVFDRATVAEAYRDPTPAVTEPA
jgi:MFS family permease